MTYFESARYYSFLRGVLFDALHCKRFAAARLSIGEHGAIVAFADLSSNNYYAKYETNKIEEENYLSYAFDERKADIVVNVLRQAVHIEGAVKGELFGRRFGLVETVKHHLISTLVHVDDHVAFQIFLSLIHRSTSHHYFDALGRHLFYFLFG